MEYFFIIAALLCALLGIAGSVIPALPGPPLSFVALLLLLPCEGNDISGVTVAVTGVAAVAITILDYVAPAWLTKKRGGSKYGIWGASIGMFVGLFLGPLGIIFAPFVGAFIGELLAKNSTEKALEMAFMSFVAFMLTTGIKFVYCIIITVFIATKCWNIIVN